MHCIAPPRPVSRLDSTRSLSLLLLALSLILTATVLAQPAGVRHVLVIGCDGLGALSFTGSNAPVMTRLMHGGAFTLRARAVIPTSSSPNWASMINGAGPEQHGITSNEWMPDHFDIAPTFTNRWGYFPTIFSVLREQRPVAFQAVVHDWQDFGRLVEPGVTDLKEWVKGSIATADRAAQVLRERQPTFTFVHFDDVDHTGHGLGWRSPQYFKTVDLVDGLIGDLLRVVDETPMRNHTLVLVTADHGGVGTKHGGVSADELFIPWIIHGPGVAAGHELKTVVNTYDTAATLAWVFGLRRPDVWIGRPVLEAFSPTP